MKPPSDDRVPLARAYDRATRAITVAIGMVLPGFLGYLLDSYLGTRVLFTLLGFGLGMSLGIWQLLRWTASSTDKGE